MAGNTTEWQFTGDASALVKELNSVIKGLQTLKKETVSTTEGLKAVTTESSHAATSQKNLNATAKSFSQTLSSLGHALHAISGPRSPMSGMANKMVELGTSTARLSGAGAGGLGKLLPVVAGVGIAVVAAAAAMIAFTSAIVGAYKWIISTVFVAEDLNAELEKLGGAGGLSVVEPGQLDSIQNVTASVDALKSVWSQFKTIIAAGVAPALEEAMVTLVALGLAAVDNFKIWAEGKNLLAELDRKSVV